MGKSLEEEKRAKILALYKKEEKIKDIAEMLSVSTRTIYQILKEEGIKRINNKETVGKISISLDQDSFDFLNTVKPRSISRYICKLIKKEAAKKNAEK